jgi:hypothetical protein
MQAKKFGMHSNRKRHRFYTGAIVMNRSTNTGGLGWTQYKFNQVSWKSIDATLRTKPDMFQIWHPKQCIGICAP